MVNVENVSFLHVKKKAGLFRFIHLKANTFTFMHSMYCDMWLDIYIYLYDEHHRCINITRLTDTISQELFSCYDLFFFIVYGYD